LSAIAAAFFVPFACAPVQAAGPGAPEKAAALDPVFVTATRSAQPIAELLADVTVIDAEEIARIGAGGLVQLLQRQAGAEIVQNGGPGAVSGILLRGANRGQTLVLIDGMRVGSASTGATTLEAIPLETIERIEILRGPASSLYGSDAIGGVVQLFTRQGSREPHAQASAGYGSYNTWSVNGAFSGSAGPVRLSLAVGEKRSDGFNAVANPAAYLYNPDRDGFRSANVAATAALPWSDGHELTAQLLRNRLNAQFDGGPGYDDRTVTVVESWQVGSRDRLTPFWVSRLSAGESRDDSLSKTGFGDFPFDTRQRQFAWQNEFALPVGRLTAGLERREERIATDAAFAVTARDTDSLFAVYQLRQDAHALQVNARHDESSQYGGQTTGALAYGYRVAPAWRLTASYGTAFKAPSFNDLYYPGFSTPTLQPEASRNVEGGVYWTGKVGGAAFEARAIGYRNRVRQLIVFQCDAYFACAPRNVDRATLSGVTLGLDGRNGDTTLAASLDLQHPQDDASGNLLPRRARQHGVVAIGRQWGPVRVGAEVVAASHRYDDAANQVRLPGYGIVNLTAEWALSRNLTAWARGDNVFDRDYQLAADYATGGATLFAGLRWQP
jgi:vitamin B12 transporter